MTPGTRHKVIGTFDDITSSTPEKSLLAPLKNPAAVTTAVR